MGSVLSGHLQVFDGYITPRFVRGDVVVQTNHSEISMRQLRAEMDDEQFHRFKQIMGKLGLDRNDEVVVELMDQYEEPPSIEEAKEVLERQGYEVIEPDDS